MFPLLLAEFDRLDGADKDDEYGAATEVARFHAGLASAELFYAALVAHPATHEGN